MRLGTRGSALALAQARLVSELLGGAELVPLTTSGDSEVATTLDGDGAQGGGEDAQSAGAQRDGKATDKSRWVDAIEEALLAGEIDLAVHSAKDVPGALADGLSLLGAPARGAGRGRPVRGTRAGGAARGRQGCHRQRAAVGPAARAARGP